MKTDKIKKIFTQILEPLALGLLALVFIIPIITVMNLTPLTKQLQKLDILGVTSQDEVLVTLVEGKHEIFSSETLNKIEDQTFNYSVTLNKRSSDNYSKPILEIENRSDSDKIITLWGQTLTNTNSSIFIKIDEKSYKVQDSKGNIYTQEIQISPSEKTILFLVIENLSGVQFSEIFDMDITISNPL